MAQQCGGGYYYDYYHHHDSTSHLSFGGMTTSLHWKHMIVLSLVRRVQYKASVGMVQQHRPQVRTQQRNQAKTCFPMDFVFLSCYEQEAGLKLEVRHSRSIFVTCFSLSHDVPVCWGGIRRNDKSQSYRYTFGPSRDIHPGQFTKSSHT